MYVKNINWVRKLTSRKFWAATADFVAMMIVAFGGAESEATKVTALIMAGAGVVAYILGEGLADAGNVEAIGIEAEKAEVIGNYIEDDGK